MRSTSNFQTSLWRRSLTHHRRSRSISSSISWHTWHIPTTEDHDGKGICEEVDHDGNGKLLPIGNYSWYRSAHDHTGSKPSGQDRIEYIVPTLHNGSAGLCKCISNLSHGYLLWMYQGQVSTDGEHFGPQGQWAWCTWLRGTSSSCRRQCSRIWGSYPQHSRG